MEQYYGSERQFTDFIILMDIHSDQALERMLQDVTEVDDEDTH